MNKATKVSQITTYFSTFCFILVLLTSCSEKSHKPNVILIVTDDQGWGDLESHGNEYVNTPSLDLLKEESVSFDRYYVSPLCAPTRASLLTGKYHTRTGTIGVTKGLERMNSEEFTLAEAFKENGYETGVFGKWHNGEHYPENPMGQGFDRFVGFCAGHWNNYFNTEIQDQSNMVQFEGYLPDFLTDKAMEFIKAKKDQPFFCYIPFNTPHTPHQVPEALFNKYKEKGLNNELAAIYGMVENMDGNVGRILSMIDEEELTENTIVLFMSDNGPNGIRFNGGMKGKKGQVHEGGVRSPLFVKWNGKLEAGKVVNQLAAHIDIFPTLIDLCDLNIAFRPSFDGKSFSQYLLGKPELTEREIFSLVTYNLNKDNTVPDQPGALRTNNFRWVKENNSFQLYDMLNDPLQKINLIDSLPEIHRVLQKKYNDWFRKATDSTDVASRTVIPVGYEGVTEINLQAPQASFSGNVRFFEGHGWANDWLTSWQEGDQITWKVDASKKSTYSVSLKYTCDSSQVGSQIMLSIGGQKIPFEINEPFNPTNIPSPDRVPRKEAYEKPWKILKLGEITLGAGVSEITMTAVHTSDTEVGHIKGLILN